MTDPIMICTNDLSDQSASYRLRTVNNKHSLNTDIILTIGVQIEIGVTKETSQAADDMVSPTLSHPAVDNG